MNTEKQLTDKQRLFCDHYLTSFNARDAARRAGYSDATARKGTLINLPQAQAYIAAQQALAAGKLVITKDMIIEELAKIAFTDIGCFYNADGSAKRLDELDDKARGALADRKVIDVYGEDKEKIGEQVHLKLHNKMEALEKLAKHLGFSQTKAYQSWN
jgi:hypothetical protein